jgi:DNA repair exonuclease SbcCD ATPase subunit
MDTMFIWIVAGAAIGLLGIFLVASERELKRKRQELEELKNKLADVPTPPNFNAPTDIYPQANETSVELIERNEDLLQQVAALSKKLEGSESKLEQLETLRAHLNSKESEITELRWDRERLNAELATLKMPSESNDSHSDEATRSQSS